MREMSLTLMYDKNNTKKALQLDPMDIKSYIIKLKPKPHQNKIGKYIQKAKAVKKESSKLERKIQIDIEEANQVLSESNTLQAKIMKDIEEATAVLNEGSNLQVNMAKDIKDLKTVLSKGNSLQTEILKDIEEAKTVLLEGETLQRKIPEDIRHLQTVPMEGRQIFTRPQAITIESANLPIRELDQEQQEQKRSVPAIPKLSHPKLTVALFFVYGCAGIALFRLAPSLFRRRAKSWIFSGVIIFLVMALMLLSTLYHIVRQAKSPN